MKLFKMGIFLMVTSLAGSAFAGSLRIAAAADLKFALEQIVKDYSMANPHDKIDVSYGSSGKFVTQIKEGAPFDLFLSADTENAQLLVADEKNVGPLFSYAQGHLVVWTKNESKLVLDKDLKVLLSPDIKKIAVANSKLAPYGRIAEAAMKKAGIFEQVSKKLVVGENISQTAQFAESGAADVSLIAMSLAQSETLKKEGRFVEVNPALYPALIQSGIVLKSKNHDTAENFKKYFLSAKSQKVMKDFGLQPVVK